MEAPRGKRVPARRSTMREPREFRLFLEAAVNGARVVESDGEGGEGRRQKGGLLGGIGRRGEEREGRGREETRGRGGGEQSAREEDNKGRPKRVCVCVCALP